MQNLSKVELEKSKQNIMRKNFRYNRYMALRYALALFFFTNLYWFFLTREGMLAWIIPASLILLGVPAAVEHVKLHGDESEEINKQLRFNQLYHYFQTAVNLVMLIIVITKVGYVAMFPFLTTVIHARIMIATVLVIGALFSLLCIRRTIHIKSNTDKHYKRVKEFEHAQTLKTRKIK